MELAESVQQTADGGFIVAGKTYHEGENKDVLVLKLLPDGTVERQKTYAGDSIDYANSVQQTTDGGYILAGRTKGNGILVMKLNPDPFCSLAEEIRRQE